MLTLKEIKKDYSVGNSKVEALKGVSLSFRKSEFVSILGPSGCGKTTLLNIIGGLDHYTSGDLIIDGISTKNYSDRDWDNYRNHRVGFVFQSYNLIPHQTILENVELSLNISGVEKSERKRRAIEALDKVGLNGQYNKKPNQLSGGQCQRVAIARAIVNNPEILLADEPTGALDTQTSVQIMEIIKEISKDCLVIMVTHNPELAEKYSTRIIKLLDGEVTSDTNPFTENEMQPKIGISDKNNKIKKSKKSKLSFWSAFKLSAKNLWSKFKRTFMVCFAGSIGIIGVATVLAVSSGVQGYINSMQNDMLSGNPITISEQTLNINAMIEASGDAANEAVKLDIKDGQVNVDFVVDYIISRSEDLASFIVTNDITQEYVDYILQMPSEYYNAINSTYGLNLSNNIYTNFNFNGQENNQMSLTFALELYKSMLEKTQYKDFSTYITTLASSFMQVPNDEEFILSQYDIVSDASNSKFATEHNEIMIVLNEDSELSDLLLAQLGYFSQEEFFNIVYRATNDENYSEAIWKERFTYEELLGKTFTWYPNDVIFNKTDENSPLFEISPFTYNPYENENWTGGEELTITAILKPKNGIAYGSLKSGIYYTHSLATKIIEQNINSQIVEYISGLKGQTMQSVKIITQTGQPIISGITYNYSYLYNGTLYQETGVVGSTNQMASLMSSMSGTTGQSQATTDVYSLSIRDVGGKRIPNKIEIYPTNFEIKDDVTKYLDEWNKDGDISISGNIITKDQRSEIQYTDALALVISLINSFINIVTYALVAFTALSLVVSTVMVAIITYVSVIERVKEIGVIRSLGGRKRDVSSLFIAETFIIGSISGVLGIAVTYGLSAILNMILGGLIGISTIAALPPTTALILIGISILLTLISGVVPARIAAHKDPVEALRSE